MKLFTKDIDTKLFEQYAKGSDLENQMVVAKIFNPYGSGTWYLLNSDPEDPEYIWAIVDMGDIEVGSVNRSDLENIRIKPFMLGLERDLSFRPVNALELYKGMNQGKLYATGGGVETDKLFEVTVFYEDTKAKADKFGIKSKQFWRKQYKVNAKNEDDAKQETYKQFLSEKANKNKIAKNLTAFELKPKMETGGGVDNENREMVLNNNKQIAHHTKEMSAAVRNSKYVPAWVVAKVNRSATDLSDATHYMEGEGESYANGGEIYKHKHMDATAKVIEKTNKGYKVEFTDNSARKPKTKIMYFNDIDFDKDKGYFEKMANGGGISEGKKYGDWSITQYMPLTYDDLGGLHGGMIKLVNQNNFDEIIIWNDKALRSPKWSISYSGVRVEDKNPSIVIEKVLKSYTNKKMSNGGNTGGTSDSAEMNAPTLGGTMTSSMATGGATKKEFIAKKVGKVMREFKDGDLHIGSSNKIVKNPKQAIAIGLSEGNKGWKHRRK